MQRPRRPRPGTRPGRWRQGLLLLATLAAGCPSSGPPPAPATGRASPLCPGETRLFGAAPPAGHEHWCRSKAANGLWINQGPSVSYHENGARHEERHYERGKLGGPYTRWDEAGNRRETGAYLDGRPHGEWVRFAADGAVKERRRYDRGRVAQLETEAPTAPAAEGPAEVAAQPTGKLFFWKVTRRKDRHGRGPTAYLLGSIHVGHYGVFPLDPTIERAFDGAGTLAIEAVGSPRDARWRRRYFNQRALLKPGTTLKNVVDEDLWDPLVATLERNGLPLDEVSQFKPWVITVLIGDVKADAMRVDGRWGIDSYFFDKARRGGKKIIGLEDYREHVKLFAQFPLREQNRMLRDELRPAEEQEREYKRIRQAWVAGDVAGLDRIFLEPLRSDPARKLYYRRLVVVRNKIMARRIARFLKRKRGNLFAIAGAAHTVGDEGVPALLTRQGFRVTQLEPY